MDVFSVQQDISPLMLAKMEKNKRKRAGVKGKVNQTQNDW